MEGVEKNGTKHFKLWAAENSMTNKKTENEQKKICIPKTWVIKWTLMYVERKYVFNGREPAIKPSREIKNKFLFSLYLF